VDGTNFRRILLRASTSQYIPFSKQGRKDTPVKNIQVWRKPLA
jgi:hypothetical protein